MKKISHHQHALDSFGREKCIVEARQMIRKPGTFVVLDIKNAYPSVPFVAIEQAM